MYLDRPRLAARLDELATRRLTAVVAGAGYGKTTLVRAWAEHAHAVTHTVRPADRDLGRFARAVVDTLRTWVPGLPADLVTAAEGSPGPPGADEAVARGEAYADHLAEALGHLLVRDLTLVLDDLHELDGAAGPVALVDGLARHASGRFHVLLASRTELPFPVERLRGQGDYGELVGPELAFLPEETASLLAALLPPPVGEELATAVHRATGGWPAAVRLTIEVLGELAPADRLARVARLPDAGDPLFRYLSVEALASVDEPTRRLLTRLAPFDRLHHGLLAALEGAASAAPATPGRLDQLARGAVWVQPGDEPGWYAMAPLVRGLLLEGATPPRVDLATGAAWYEAQGEPALALGAWRRHGDEQAVADLLHRRGRTLVATGRAGDVVDALVALPADHRDEALDLLWAEALQVRGDWEGALAALGRHTEGVGTISAELAWRVGVVHHFVGALDEAEAAYERGVIDGSAPVDEALLLAWWGSLAWLRGDAEACHARAVDALARATESGDDRALATAHTVAAMDAALHSDRAANDAHYLQALDHAAAARDLLLTIRIRNNRGSRLLEEGFYEEALVELDIAIELADLAGSTLFRAMALSNRGEALSGLGRLEEAVRDLEASRDLHQRLGTRMIAYPLVLLGDVFLLRGARALAHGCYEEAVARAEPVGDLQGLVPALAGLARVLAEDDVDEAAKVAARAVDLGPVLGQVQALLASAEVARKAGDRAATGAHAAAAATTARQRRDRAGLAEALELLAFAEPDRATDHLDEAEGLWEALRAPIGTARVRLARLSLGAPRPGLEHHATELATRFRELGCRRLAAEATALTARAPEASPELEITTLGGFGVRHRGQAVAHTAWQSRKARDLLKILVARRGAPVPRDQLMDLLWPDEEPAKASRRLSVTLSTLRAVLDPERGWAADHWVVADSQALRLDRDHVVIDVERFLDAAEQALDLPDTHRDRVPALLAAEAEYLGDLLEEDLYEEWTVPLRERARDTYLRVARALSEQATARGDDDGAARFHRRVLERDRYDEGAHLGLVRALASAGHHGAARRAYRVYVQRMGELDVEAVPYPAVGRDPNDA